MSDLKQHFNSWLSSSPGSQHAKSSYEPLLAKLTQFAESRDITVSIPFPNIKHSFVAPVVCSDGSRAVIKAGSRGDACSLQAAALKCYFGKACVQIIDSDIENGIILLELLNPGIPLTSLSDETNDRKATSIAVNVMRNLWVPVPANHQFPTISDWARAYSKVREMFAGSSGPIPVKLFDLGEGLFADLLISSSSPVLLHGDLHHDNILSSERGGWLAIDPKGVIGEPAYETGAILRNLWSDRHRIDDPKGLLTRRVHQFADELNLDKRRIHQWAIAQAVLAACWGLEDGENYSSGWIQLCQLLASLKV